VLKGAESADALKMLVAVGALPDTIVVLETAPPEEDAEDPHAAVRARLSDPVWEPQPPPPEPAPEPAEGEEPAEPAPAPEPAPVEVRFNSISIRF